MKPLRLDAPVHTKSTNGANGRRAGALRNARRLPAEPRERRPSREKADNPFVEKSRTWVLALRGGAVLSLATFALVAVSQGISKPVLGERDADTVAYSLAFVPARPDESSSRAPAAWPLEDDGGARAPDPATASAGDRALPESSAGKADPEKDAAQPTKEAGIADTGRERTLPQRRPQGPAALSAESGPGRKNIGAKRRTSVAIEEEKIVVKAALPKQRVLTVQPQETFRPKPVYPPSALKKEVEGAVRVKFLVTATGSVKNLEVLWAEPAGHFEDNVKEAVSQWRFVPGKDQDGKPMEAEQVYTYRFQFEGPGT